MGWFSNGVCYPTAAAAAGAECGNYPQSSVTGPSAVVVSCHGVAVDGSALIVSSHVVGHQVSTQSALTLAFPTCDEDAIVNDGLQFFGLAIVALSAVYAMRALVLRFLLPT